MCVYMCHCCDRWRFQYKSLIQILYFPAHLSVPLVLSSRCDSRLSPVPLWRPWGTSLNTAFSVSPLSLHFLSISKKVRFEHTRPNRKGVVSFAAD